MRISLRSKIEYVQITILVDMMHVNPIQTINIQPLELVATNDYTATRTSGNHDYTGTRTSGTKQESRDISSISIYF